MGFPIFIALMLLLNYFTSNDYISLVCSVAVCVELLICKPDVLLPNMIFYSLFAYLFHYGDYAIYVFICIAFLIRVALQSEKNFKTILVIVPLYFFTHLISTSFSLISIGDLIPFFSILCLLGACLIYKPIYRETSISYFIVGYILSAIFGTMKSFTRLAEVSHITYTTVDSWQDTLRFAGVSYDPNFYTLLTMIAFMLLFFGGIAQKHKLLVGIGTIVALVTGVITYSKSFYITFALLMVVYLFSNHKKIVKRVGYVFIAILVGFIFFSEQIINLLEPIIVRFTGGKSMNDFTTGRVDLWTLYWNDIFKTLESFFIGNGIQDFGQAAAHNTYLELLYKFGIFGVLFDLLLLNVCVKSIPKSTSRSLIVKFGILTIFLALLFALSAYTFSTLWTCIFLIILLFRTKGEEVNKSGIKYNNTGI